MMTPSAPVPPDVAGYGVVMGNGVVYVQLTGLRNYVVGGTMSLRMAREFARTILQVAGEVTDDA